MIPAGTATRHPQAATTDSPDREPDVMDDTKTTLRKPAPARRRWRWALAALLVLGIGLVAALPWLLSTAPARSLIVAQINRAIAPSRVEVRAISASWRGPIRASGLTLRDGRGKVLIEAPRAALNKGLLPLAIDHADLGTLTLVGAALDLERRADGSIDLVDALTPPKPAPTAEPAAPPAPAAPPVTAKKAARAGISATLRVVGGSLRLRSPELAGPLTAGRMDLDATLPGTPGRNLSWKLRLAMPEGGTDAETLALDGEFDLHAAATPDLGLAVNATRWPLALAARGAVVAGRLDGEVKLGRSGGRWAAAGDATLRNLDASGPALAGDRLRLDKVAGVWDLAQTAEAWTVRRLSVTSPVGELIASGSIAADGGAPAARVDGRVDLAALARQLPHTLRLREGLTLDRGAAHLRVDVKTQGTTQQGSVEAKLTDLVARDEAKAFTLRDPATITARATRTATGVRVEAAAVKAAFLDLKGSGDLDRGVKLAGTIDLGALEAQFRELVDFGKVALAGRGRMAADFRRIGPNFLGRFAAEVKGLRLAGLTAEPIVRDTVRLDASAGGPADDSGLPRSWRDLRAGLKSSRDALSLMAEDRDGTMLVNASASFPLTVSSNEAQADVKFNGRWGKGTIDFDLLRLGLRPADPATAAAGTVAFAAGGRFDLAGDNLVIFPAPAGPGASLKLAPEGAWFHGLRAGTPATRAGKITLGGDLAAIDGALAAWTGKPPRGYAGTLAAQFGLTPAAAGPLNFEAKLTVPDLTRAHPDGKGRKAEGPFNLALGGTYQPGADRVTLGGFTLYTRYLNVAAAGTLDDPGGRRVADLRGMLIPNWEALSAMATGSTGPKARLRGGVRPFAVKGALAGDSTVAILKGLDAEIGLELTSAEAYGVTLGAAPVVIRCAGGAVTIDPIRTTLNGGDVDLKPGVALDEATGLIALTLAAGSKVEGAQINDEVSRQLLRYVAPVLDEATQVNGKVSVAVDRAEFPIEGPEGRSTTLTGGITFQDVVFAPGPFAKQVLTLAGRADAPGLRLQQPIQLAIADHRVIQKGLEVPFGGDARIALEGSVGFDETLDLRANVPITRGMLGNNAGLDELVGDRRVTVPIGGTVAHPKVNRQALQVAIRQLSRDVLKRGVSREESRLLDKVVPRGAIPGGRPGAGASGGAGGAAGELKDLEGELFRRVLPGRGNR